ncbi:MAG: copper amine oxidase N-terminal domain-containing protein [Firmicutes bacterium]|nr:copper amine oxidase N-terminal domain-containing protein [Bacillota bacterium]
MLKKIMTASCFSLAIAAVCAVFVHFAKDDAPPATVDNKVYAAQEEQDKKAVTIELSVGSHILTVNGEEQPIDEQGTVPIVENGRTLLPVRAIIETVGGSIEWNTEEKASTITYNDDTVKLVIDSETAYKNGDDACIIGNNR